jgi:hypothetical protein
MGCLNRSAEHLPFEDGNRRCRGALGWPKKDAVDVGGTASPNDDQRCSRGSLADTVRRSMNFPSTGVFNILMSRPVAASFARDRKRERRAIETTRAVWGVSASSRPFVLLK